MPEANPSAYLRNPMFAALFHMDRQMQAAGFGPMAPDELRLMAQQVQQRLAQARPGGGPPQPPQGGMPPQPGNGRPMLPPQPGLMPQARMA